MENFSINRFVEKHSSEFSSLVKANQIIRESSGICNFFLSEDDLDNFVSNKYPVYKNTNVLLTREYGDYQTNENLVKQIVKYVLQKNKHRKFTTLVEPTCGIGNFVLAALCEIPTLKKIIAIEINPDYVLTAKLRVLEYFLSNPKKKKLHIEIINGSFFNYEFDNLFVNEKKGDILLLGNPPWITNSELGVMGSVNLPVKSNLKASKGLDALTGKSNFDISESVITGLLERFHKKDGFLAFLVKNSVVKTLVYDQLRHRYRIADIEKSDINAKKEFNASVEACLLTADLNREPEYVCRERKFDKQNVITNFGWNSSNFVYSTSEYEKDKDLEGESVFIWRQGVKHDCSKVMELERKGNIFVNNLGNETELEEDLIYPFLKSSDLQTGEVKSCRKYIIMTQKKVGEDTTHIKKKYPEIYSYLLEHEEYFLSRKSSIYKNKPRFSIFGIGAYSFLPYKVAISGMYKKVSFSLVSPIENKPVMLDDTCYFIGFDNYSVAKGIQSLLNSSKSNSFLKSIIFPDAKRAITKEVLMRINFPALFEYYFQNVDDSKKNGISEEIFNSLRKAIYDKG